MTNIQKLGNRKFKLTWNWNETQLVINFQPLADEHTLAGQQGILIDWQAKLRAGEILKVGKKLENRFGRTWVWKQKEVAERLGLTQPRVSDIVNGKIDEFTLDTLFSILDKSKK